MSEFVMEDREPSCESPYHGWSREKRDAFIYELVPIIRDNTVFGVAGLVDVRAYDDLATPRFREFFEHPYHVCFELFFDCFFKALTTEFNDPFPEDEVVDFFFDRQDEFKEKALTTYGRVRATGVSADFMGGISFEDKARFIPLQAADLLAFRMRKVFTRIIAGKQGFTPGSWDDVLGKRGHITMRYIDRETMTEYAASGEQLGTLPAEGSDA